MSEPKTVRVRIAVAVGPDGNWHSAGSSFFRAEDAYRFAASGCSKDCRLHWLTADLTIPTIAEVTAEVEESK